MPVSLSLICIYLLELDKFKHLEEKKKKKQQRIALLRQVQIFQCSFYGRR